MKTSPFILTIGLLLLTISVNAQSKTSNDAQLKIYRNSPIWINMMEDPKVNYREAVLAFDEFWKGKPEPEEMMRGGEEVGEEEEHERSIWQRLKKSDKKYREEICSYSEAYKKFSYWKMRNAAYVKEDGTLMSESEKQALLEQELRNGENTPFK